MASCQTTITKYDNSSFLKRFYAVSKDLCKSKRFGSGVKLTAHVWEDLGSIAM